MAIIANTKELAIYECDGCGKLAKCNKKELSDMPQGFHLELAEVSNQDFLENRKIWFCGMECLIIVMGNPDSAMNLLKSTL